MFYEITKITTIISNKPQIDQDETRNKLEAQKFQPISASELGDSSLYAQRCQRFLKKRKQSAVLLPWSLSHKSLLID